MAMDFHYRRSTGKSKLQFILNSAYHIIIDRRLRCTKFPPSSKLIGVGIVLDERRKRLCTRETSHGQPENAQRVCIPAARSSRTNRNRTLAAEEESFKWSEVRRGILDVQLWLSATAYFAILSGLYSFGLFVSQFLL